VGLLAAIALALPSGSLLGADARVFTLAIRDQRVDVPERTIRVTRNDRVELHWSADEPTTLHLHGYDLEVEVSPERPASMRFEARITGRFPVARHRHRGGHGHHEPVLYLEVHPD